VQTPNRARLLPFVVVALICVPEGTFTQLPGRSRIVVELSAPEATVVTADAARRAGRSFDAAAHEEAIAVAQNALLEDLKSRGIDAVVTTTTLYLAGGLQPAQPNRFSELINAIGLDVPSAAVDAIRAMASVRYVTPDEPARLDLDNSVRYIRANDGPGVRTIFTQAGGAPTQFDGSGQVIAILDSGIERTHPMFDARFDDSQFEQRTGDVRPARLAGEPYVQGVHHAKVVYFLPLTATQNEDDAGHGTHAAADAAGLKVRTPGADKIPGTADDDPIVEGVAPGALLMNYKLCESIHTCVGTASVVTAMTDAVRTTDPLGFPKPVATVISTSWGDGVGNPNSAPAVAASNAALAGAVPVASAGNSGQHATTLQPVENSVGGPSSGRRVISVGATNDPGFAANEIDVLQADPARYTSGGASTGGQNDAGRSAAPQDRRINAFLMAGASDVPFPLGQHYVYVGLADMPTQVPPEVRGRIALAVRGSTASQQGQSTGTFQNKAANVAAKGGIGLVVMNNVAGELTGTSAGTAVIPVYGISQENGVYLRDTLGFAGNFNPSDFLTWGTISNLPLRIGLRDPSTFSATTAAFSSRGPLDAFGFVKPDVTAPGMSIYSATVPYNHASVSTAPSATPLGMSNATRFISANGTSFSTPQVAGSAALVRQALLAFRGIPPAPPADLRNGAGAAYQVYQNAQAPMSIVRAMLTNTATNLREADGETVVPDGDRRTFIHEIGSGLVHVKRAVAATAVLGTNDLVPAGNGAAGPDSAGDANFLPSHSFGQNVVINTNNPAQAKSITVTLQNVAGASAAGTWTLALVDGGRLAGYLTRPIDGTTGFAVALDASSVSLGSAVNDRATFTVTVTVDGRPAPTGLAEAGPDPTNVRATEFLWWVVATGPGGQSLRMPFFYRARR